MRTAKWVTILVLLGWSVGTLAARPITVRDPNFPLIQTPAVFHAQRQNKGFNVPQGQTLELFRAEGPSCIRHFWLVPGNPEANPILRVYADDADKPQVEMHMDRFFGVLLGKKPYRLSCAALEHLPMTKSPVQEAGYNCYLPIPFRTSCRITIEAIDEPIAGEAMADWQQYSQGDDLTPYRLRADTESVAYYYLAHDTKTPTVRSPDHWPVTSPLPCPHCDAFERAELPERTPEPWGEQIEKGGTPLPIRTVASKHAWVDLSAVYHDGAAPETLVNHAVYARTRIKSDDDTTASLRIGFDDWLTLWLIGKRLKTLRHDTVLKAANIPIQLTKGDNELAIKLSNLPNTSHRLWVWSCVVADEPTAGGNASDGPPAAIKGAAEEFRPAIAHVTLDRGQVTPGSTLQATCTFHSSGPAPSDLTVFVHVVRPDGGHIGADFEPDLPTTEWPRDAFVRQGPFPIAVPEDAAPGTYQVWMGMFSPGGGDRIEFNNVDRVRGHREYHAAEFEVRAAGSTVEVKPVAFSWLPVDEAKVARSPGPASPAGPQTLERLTLSVDRKVLNPVREPNVSAKLTLTGFYSDGSKRNLGPAEGAIKARTKSASGNVEVVTVEGDKVVPREGGIATIEATIAQAGKRFKATTDVVVTPFYREYHQTLVLKLFLGMEGEPVERLAKEPLFQKKHDVLCTFEEALEVIRKTDNLTRGIPKIVYLVGWQKGGHDHLYPAWNEVNPRLKRNQDATALESLRWLIREATRFNTTVSLHINMVDAYGQSPLWDEYVAKDCFARDANGRLLVAGIQMKREDMYNVVYPKEWEAGLAQRRIDGLIAMIPELRDGHTIHIDVFIAQRDGGKPISPWHAKPENGGLTPDKYVETQRRIFKYWRERGFDVTGEGIFWAHPPGEGFTGLQSMSWWYPGDPDYQMRTPECLMARGRTDRGGDGDFRFGSSMHGEEIWQKDKDQMPGFLGMFCRTTLPWYYLSRLEREKFENGALFYSAGVVARTEGGKRIIRKGEFVLRDDDDLFVPALWNENEIIAYSRQGYQDKSWRLPDDWREVKSVDLYRVSLDGCAPLSKGVSVKNSSLVLSLTEGTCVSIVPAGARPSGRVAASGPANNLPKPDGGRVPER